MSEAHSPSAGRPYGLSRVCRLWRFSRSTAYDHRKRAKDGVKKPRKRGPTGPCSDAELLDHAKAAQAESPWVGEGHRKTWARLRFKGIRTSRPRLLRILRENGLLAPHVLGRAHGPKAHDGTIIPERPDEMWGTDATGTLTDEGMATVFPVVDHATGECLGLHAARRGTRFEAIEVIRQAVRRRFGKFDRDVAPEGLKLRHDHGSQFVSHAYQDELKFLGITSSPAYVREPEGNGCTERFIRTLKEQLLWLRRFATIDELNLALQDFLERYNNEWLIERHGWISPSAYRQQFQEPEEEAA